MLRAPKKRALNFQPSVDQRQLRAHRRSIHNRSSRQDAFNRNRALDTAMEIVEESKENNSEEVPPAVSVTGISMRDKLKRWKEDKELKRRLGMINKPVKPVFKVGLVRHEMQVFLASSSDVRGRAVATDRVTRSSAKQDCPAQVVQSGSVRAQSAHAMTLRSSASVPANSVSSKLTAAGGVVRKLNVGRGKLQKNILKQKPTFCTATTTTQSSCLSLLPCSEVEAQNVSFAPDNHEFIPPMGTQAFDFNHPQGVAVMVVSDPEVAWKSPCERYDAAHAVINENGAQQQVPTEDATCGNETSRGDDDVLTSTANVLSATSSSFCNDPKDGKDVAPSDAATESPFKIPVGTAKKKKISPLLFTSPWINRKRRSSRHSSQGDSPSPVACAIRMSPEDLFKVQDCEELMTTDLQLDSSGSSLEGGKCLNTGSMDVECKDTDANGDPGLATDSKGVAEEQRVALFRNLLETNTAHLNSLCDEWERIMHSETSLLDNVVGRIHSAIGKAKLLMNERFKQFSGLVDDCQYARGEKLTTCSDLQGFWDMIHFQVDDVVQLFKKLERIRGNEWQDEQTPVKKCWVMAPKKTTRNAAAGVKLNDEERSRAARQRLANFKLRAAQQNKPEVDDIVANVAGLAVTAPEGAKPMSTSENVKPAECQHSEPLLETSAEQHCSRRRSLRTSLLSRHLICNVAQSPLAESSNCSVTTGTSKSDGARLSELFSPLRSFRELKSESMPKISLESITENRKSTNLMWFADKENAENPLAPFLVPTEPDSDSDTSSRNSLGSVLDFI